MYKPYMYKPLKKNQRTLKRFEQVERHTRIEKLKIVKCHFSVRYLQFITISIKSINCFSFKLDKIILKFILGKGGGE